ncbi:rhodanese-like domain-containing protein [Cellulomonas sp. Sa3CUA2]|uniref:Rhodanese-like domain-containing protein n=1 Tax=Cellulomonas avistercoris TaxID=2762242 RepID=A0ABR8QG40_9CELL|nr:rhodanese-like domain-containing protein [Cellulomonas avistercoris]MBD7919360.1 rhodanese-like domain-containing protein [Cellulomonas avistercoris]
MSLRDTIARLLGRTTTDGGLPATVDGPTAVQLVRDGASVLDVRERSEWSTGHAAPAVHVPLAEVATAPRRLRKDAPVVVMCASGMRSRTAAKQLRALGLQATSLSGGISAWQAAGGAVRR